MTLQYGQLSSHLTSRLRATDEFEKKLANLRTDEELLKADMLAAVPQAILQFIDDQEVIDTVVTYGRCYQKVIFGKGADHFKSYDDAAAKIKQLQRAWKKVVKIQLGTKRSIDGIEIEGRADISFYSV